VDVRGFRVSDPGAGLAGNVHHRGFPAIIWAFCWWVLVKDKPSQVGWLSESEKAALQAQLEKEQQGIKAVRNYSEAFRSRNVILLCMQYFTWSIGVYGFVLWLPSIIRNGGANLGWLRLAGCHPYLIWRRRRR
jgi:sugar phosphate permease